MSSTSSRASTAGCLFLLAFLSAIPAHAQPRERCATDAFGNTVCMDKDGVINVAPQATPREGKSASDDTVKGSKDAVAVPPRRCAVDDFGNKVCSD